VETRAGLPDERLRRTVSYSADAVCSVDGPRGCRATPNRRKHSGVIPRLDHGEPAAAPISAEPRDLARDTRGPGAAASRMARIGWRIAIAAAAVRLPRRDTRVRGQILRPCKARRGPGQREAGPQDDVIEVEVVQHLSRMTSWGWTPPTQGFRRMGTRRLSRAFDEEPLPCLAAGERPSLMRLPPGPSSPSPVTPRRLPHLGSRSASLAGR
jgi:hypothetical protein